MLPTKEVMGLAKKSSEWHFLSRSRSILALALRNARKVSNTASVSEFGGVSVMFGVTVGSSLNPSCARILARRVRTLRCRRSSALLRLQDFGCTLGMHAVRRQAATHVNLKLTECIADTKVARFSCLLTSSSIAAIYFAANPAKSIVTSSIWPGMRKHRPPRQGRGQRCIHWDS